MPRWPSKAAAQADPADAEEAEPAQSVARPLRARVLGALRAADSCGDTTTAATLSGVASALGDLFAAAQKGAGTQGISPVAAQLLAEIMAL